MVTADERQAIVDDEHLKLLRIGFFVSAAESGLFSLIGGFYLGIGVMMRFIFEHAAPRGQPPPEIVYRLFGVLGAALFILFVGMMLLKLYVAKCIRLRQSHGLCLVMAVLVCFSIPYGTMLGMCGFLVLTRPSVKQVFLGPSV